LHATFARSFAHDGLSESKVLLLAPIAAKSFFPKTESPIRLFARDPRGRNSGPFQSLVPRGGIHSKFRPEVVYFTNHRSGEFAMLKGTLYLIGIVGVDISATLLLFHYMWMWLGE
jgi:hypothetical protein